jgi:hypothetical protein
MNVATMGEKGRIMADANPQLAILLEKVEPEADISRRVVMIMVFAQRGRSSFMSGMNDEVQCLYWLSNRELEETLSAASAIVIVYGGSNNGFRSNRFVRHV